MIDDFTISRSLPDHMLRILNSRMFPETRKFLQDKLKVLKLFKRRHIILCIVI